MIRALLFFVKVAIFVAVAVWVAERPGTVTFEWLDTTVTMHTGVFFLICLGTILLALILFRILNWLANMPKMMSRYRQDMGAQKGYRALTLGLTAVAAGDAKIAQYQAHRARKFLPSDHGLPVLLEAQAARLQGDEGAAAQSFALLLENPDTAFLGIRGLLQNALEDHDYDRARVLAEKALALHPKQKWILKIVYDLQIRARDFDATILTLYRAEKAGAIAPDRAASDRIVMLLMQAQAEMNLGPSTSGVKKLEKAYGYDKSFIPTVMALSRAYLARGNRSKAVKIIEKAWKVNTHPDLVDIWIDAMPKAKQGNKNEILKWCERLLEVNPQSAEGHLAVAKAAIDAGIWGEARDHLKKAEAIRPSVRLYKFFAELEEKSTKDEIAIRHWLSMAADAPSDRVWVCVETGRVYTQWHPVAEPHGSFNTIVWDFPEGGEHALLLDHVLEAGNAVVLEAPRA